MHLEAKVTNQTYYQLVGELRAIGSMQKAMLVYIATKEGSTAAKILLSSAQQLFEEHVRTVLDLTEKTVGQELADGVTKASEALRGGGHQHFKHLEQAIRQIAHPR